MKHGMWRTTVDGWFGLCTLHPPFCPRYITRSCLPRPHDPPPRTLQSATVIIRGDYGYGASGSPPKIPANATLHFDIELLSWRSDKDLTGALGGRQARTATAWDCAESRPAVA